MNVIEASLALDRRQWPPSALRRFAAHSQLGRWPRTRLLVADYANEGVPLCFNEYVVPRRPLQAGTVVEGKVRIEIR